MSAPVMPPRLPQFGIKPTEPSKEVELEARFKGLIDLVDVDGEVEFLYLADDGQLAHAPCVQLPTGRTVIPPSQKHIPFPLSTWRDVACAEASRANAPPMQWFKDLLEESRAYITASVLLPDPVEPWADTFAMCVFVSYVQELVHYCPIVLLEGVVGRGKTRLGKAITHQSYRGVHVSSARQASLYRVSGHWDATLFLDISEFTALTKGSESAEMVLSRFERDIRVPRVNNPQAGPYSDTEYYDLFGPTIIATNSAVVEAIRSRSIAPVMPDGSHVSLADASSPPAAAALRARLLVFRAELMRWGALPAKEEVAPGRLGNITRPLVQLMAVVAPDRVERLIAHIGTLEVAARERRADTLEGRVVRVLVMLRPQVRHGRLAVSDITKWVNKDFTDADDVPAQRIGKVLESLGITRRLSNGRSYVVYDSAQVTSLARTWYIDDSPEGNG